MRVRTAIAGALASASFLAGCSAAPDQAPTPLPASIISVDDVSRELGVAYSEVQSFWLTQGIEDRPALLQAGADETIACGTETVSPAKGREVVAAFCNPRKAIIVWSDALAKQSQLSVNQGAEMKPLVAEVVAHGYAQFAQQYQGVLPQVKEVDKIGEPQADCLAGLAMRGHYANALPSVQKMFNSIEGIIGRKDIRHGDGQKRFVNFILGYLATGDDIRICDQVIPLG
jgi:hypothetical protein